MRELSLSELATANGLPVSRLIFWRQQGLLPAPHVVRLGKGKGTRSLYPTETGEILQLLSKPEWSALSVQTRLARLWLLGFSVRDSKLFARMVTLLESIELEPPDDEYAEDALFAQARRATTTTAKAAMGYLSPASSLLDKQSTVISLFIHAMGCQVPFDREEYAGDTPLANIVTSALGLDSLSLSDAQKRDALETMPTFEQLAAALRSTPVDDRALARRLLYDFQRFGALLAAYHVADPFGALTAAIDRLDFEDITLVVAWVAWALQHGRRAQISAVLAKVDSILSQFDSLMEGQSHADN